MGMTTLLPEDLAWCIRRLPKDAKKLLLTPGPRLCVAGGFVRSCIAHEEINEINDVDVFAPTGGYRIPLDSLAKVCARLLVGLRGPVDTLPLLAEEAAFGDSIEGLLRLVDPGVDPAHEAHLPSTHEKTV